MAGYSKEKRARLRHQFLRRREKRLARLAKTVPKPRARLPATVPKRGGRKPLPIDWATVGLAVKNNTELAMQLRVSVGTVGVYRRRLGIPNPRRPGSPRIPLTAEIVALIGTTTDAEVARRAGVSKEIIRLRRQELQIAKYRGPRPGPRVLRPLAPDRLAALRAGANLTLAELGRRLGLSGERIRQLWVLYAAQLPQRTRRRVP